MKSVILAGGFGTRISEETVLKPKPLIEIGGMPLLWHIMKIYSTNGINDFIICCGYKGNMIKEYFANYSHHNSDISIDIQKNNIDVIHLTAETWNITLVDTGTETMTGGRLKRVQKYLDDESFCFTYGDGLGNINVSDVVNFHKKKQKIATLTAVKPPGRFGVLNIEGDDVVNFKEKPAGDGNWINGGYFVLEPDVFDYIKDDSTVWEREPLEQLAQSKQLSAFTHDGFWHPVDTMWDKNHLNNLWKTSKAPWKIW